MRVPRAVKIVAVKTILGLGLTGSLYHHSQWHNLGPRSPGAGRARSKKGPTKPFRKRVFFTFFSLIFQLKCIDINLFLVKFRKKQMSKKGEFSPKEFSGLNFQFNLSAGARCAKIWEGPQGPSYATKFIPYL